MNGLLGQAAPVIRLSRSVLPPSEFRLRGLLPVAASPVPTNSEPSLAISRRQPPCWPVVAGMPVTRRRTRVARSGPVRSRHETTRTSCPPPVRLAPWQV